MFDFSGDKNWFLIAGGSANETGVSVWSRTGEFIGETEPVKAEWVVFAKSRAAVVVGLTPRDTGGAWAFWLGNRPSPADAPKHEIEVFDIDALGNLAQKGRVSAAAAFDWSLLKGAELRTRIDADIFSAAPDQSKQKLPCGGVRADFRVGFGICERTNQPPVLFDVGTRNAIGELTPWTGGPGGNMVFSREGTTLMLSSTTEPNTVAAWDIPSRKAKQRVPPKWPPYSVEWIDTTGSRAILSSSNDGSFQLTLWDVDNNEAVRVLEIDAMEVAEFGQDSNAMSASPTSETLLQIARRRLRRCETAH
jgi:WD40 repeat protein